MVFVKVFHDLLDWDRGQSCDGLLKGLKVNIGDGLLHDFPDCVF